MTRQKQWLVYLVCPIATILFCVSSQAVTIDVVTEDEYPVQYVKDGTLIGPAYEVVKQVLDRAGYPHQATVLPWSRAYNKALTQPNTLIFSMVRSSQRESLFHWIGEIHRLEYVLIKLKKRSDLQFNSLNTLGDARIGVIRDSALHLYMKKLGLDYNLLVVSNEQPSYNVLLKERVEYIPRNRLTIPFDCVQHDMDCEQFEVATELNEFTQGFYLAMSKTTAPEVVEKIKAAFQQLSQDGQIEVIMQPTYSAQAIDDFKKRYLTVSQP